MFGRAMRRAAVDRCSLSEALQKRYFRITARLSDVFTEYPPGPRVPVGSSPIEMTAPHDTQTIESALHHRRGLCEYPQTMHQWEARERLPDPRSHQSSGMLPRKEIDQWFTKTVSVNFSIRTLPRQQTPISARTNQRSCPAADGIINLKGGSLRIKKVQFSSPFPPSSKTLKSCSTCSARRWAFDAIASSELHLANRASISARFGIGFLQAT